MRTRTIPKLRLIAARAVITMTALALLVGCFPKQATLEPNLTYVPTVDDVTSLAPPFAALEPEERKEDWGREFTTGLAFAKELELYRAVTDFKRALALLPPHETAREQEILYFIALCYYLGARYSEAVSTVETTNLNRVTVNFPAYRELLILLHESYRLTDRPLAAEGIREKLEKVDPPSSHNLALSTALTTGDIDALTRFDLKYPSTGLSQLLSNYHQCEKSVTKAQVASAIVPGLGYWYVGQKQSAITAFLLNGLFIAASVQLFRSGYWPVGVFTTSMELGWYCGGIYGAGEAAHVFNQQLYEGMTRPLLAQQNLYPLFMMRWSF